MVLCGMACAAITRHASADEPESLRVLTFNAFIAPGISPDIDERLTRLGPAVASLEPDLVGLQEVWKDAHAERVGAALAEAGLEHQHWVTRPGTPPLGSSGLLTASRFPIVHAEFFPFTAGDAPPFAFHADWMAGKGVLLTRVRTPWGVVDFANTHLHGNYRLHDYEGVRLAQMSEIATFLGGRQRQGPDAPPLVLAGDLNSRPRSLPFRLLTETAQLAPVSAELDIDHILVPSAGRVALRPVDVRTVLTEPVELSDGQRVTLSDHPGVLAVLEPEQAPAAPPAVPATAAVTGEAMELARREIRTSQLLRWPALFVAVVGAAAGVQLGRRALRHRRKRAWWVLASLGVAIGVAWLGYLSLVYWPGHVEDLEATQRRLERH